MNILFITRLYAPHIGGVETHIYELSRILKQKGHGITILTEKYDSKLKDKETADGIKIVRFSYPHIKFIGLKYIWLRLFQNIDLVRRADIVHIHDVFIWYLPFLFLFPNKKVITTFHGLEWDTPLSKTSLWQKRLADKLSTKTIGIGKFLEKYTKIKFDLISYGAAHVGLKNIVKNRNTFVYVGRLEANTGLLQFLKWLDEEKRLRPVATGAETPMARRVDFIGDGRLRNKCKKYGKVYGFTDSKSFYKKAEYCIPGGYLAALEALSYKCKLKLFWNNKIKEDYWKMSPFVRKDVANWARKQTWDKLANEHINLYNNI